MGRSVDGAQRRMSHTEYIKAQGAPDVTKGKIMTAKATKAQDVPAVEAQAQAQHFGIEALVEATGAPAKDVRRWLRAQARNAGAGEALPGKGGRYAFTAAHIEALAGAYAKGKARKGTAAPADAITKALGL